MQNTVMFAGPFRSDFTPSAGLWEDRINSNNFSSSGCRRRYQYPHHSYVPSERDATPQRPASFNFDVFRSESDGRFLFRRLAS